MKYALIDKHAGSVNISKACELFNARRQGYYEWKQRRGGKLGIPSFRDKLVQDAIRQILEAIYEPIFSEQSHGFRPNRSCHAAFEA